MYNLGIKPDRIIGHLSQILDASKEAENAIDAADGLLICRLKDYVVGQQGSEGSFSNLMARCMNRLTA